MQFVYFINGLLSVFFWSYLCGSIPNGLLIGKFNGLDIREHGSHNIGATNVNRILGRDWGILCFILDFLKGCLPVWIIGMGYGGQWTIGAQWGALVAAIAAVIGHVFPVWLKFHGGKGVATSLGVVCGLAWLPLLFGLLTWVICFYSFRRIVSIASMAAVTVMGMVAIVMFIRGTMAFVTSFLIVVLAVLVIVRHKENIIRLLHGNENSFVKVKGKRRK